VEFLVDTVARDRFTEYSSFPISIIPILIPSCIHLSITDSIILEIGSVVKYHT